MPVGDIWELALYQLLFGIRVVNTFHFRFETVGATAAGLADDFDAQIVNANWKANVSNNVAFQSLNLRKVFPAGDDTAFKAISYVGAVNAASAPPNCVGIVTWRTGTAGRRRRGRTYISGNNQEFSGASWGANVLARMGFTANAMFARYKVGGSSGVFTMGVWSRIVGMALPNPPHAEGFAPVTAFTVQAYVGSMGSRRSGHGV